MVNKSETKIYSSQGRHFIYLKSDFVKDDRFPFKVGEQLEAEIIGNKLFISKKKKK